MTETKPKRRWFRFSLRTPLLWLVVAISGCGSSDVGVKITSFDVGIFDASNGEFTATKVVPFKVGQLYGYQLSLSSTSGVVHLKEVLDLPGAATWADSTNDPAAVKNLGAETTNNGKTHIQQYKIECGDRTAVFRQKYRIAESDPRGPYKFTIYLDGQLAYESEFVLR
jgi:hypothetical protein